MFACRGNSLCCNFEWHTEKYHLQVLIELFSCKYSVFLCLIFRTCNFLLRLYCVEVPLSGIEHHPQNSTNAETGANDVKVITQVIIISNSFFVWPCIHCKFY